jgi:iron complex outermembrane receptor protein
MAQGYKFSIFSLAALGAAIPAAAQEAAPPAEREAPAAVSRDVVVVTANKREESVQDIAIAVTALSDQAREEIGLTTVQDLTNLTPGLSYSSSNERVFLRGVGRNTNNFGSEPGVANYDDGIYTSFATLGSRDQIFVERTEILRGPQGTLYGRNSVGGALNVISKRPTSDFETDVRLSYGSYDSGRVAAAISGPITDSLRYRVAGAQRWQHEGYLDNVATGESEYGNADDYTIEFQLEGEVGENTSFWYKHNNGGYVLRGPPGGRTNAGALAEYEFTFAPPSAIAPNAAYGFTVPHTQVGTVTSNPALRDWRTFNTDYTDEARLNGYNSDILEVIYETPLFDIKYLGGAIYYDYELQQDNDGTPVTGFNRTAGGRNVFIDPRRESLYNENRAFFSNEVNFISTYDSPLQWIAGLYAYQENFEQPTISYMVNPVPQLLAPTKFVGSTPTAGAANPDGLLSYTNNIGLNNSYGTFVQGDYQFTEQWKATVGVRYSLDNKHIREEARLLCYFVCNPVPSVAAFDGMDITDSSWAGNPPGTQGVVVDPTTDPVTGIRSRLLADEWSATTGTAGLEWTPDSSQLIFAKYSRGYKAGGFNATSMQVDPRTDKEKIDSYELGYKKEFAALNLTTNFAGFLYSYKDVQTPITIVPDNTPSYTAFVNLPEVETTGLELESTWSPIQSFQLLFNYAWLNAEIQEGCCYVDPVDPRGQLPGALPVEYVPAAGFTAATVNPGDLRTYTAVRQNVAGNKLPQSPEHKVAVNGQYTWMFDPGSLMASVSWYWRDGFYTSFFNRDFGKTPDYDQTDARLIWRSEDDRYTLIGFVRNVFDQDGYDGVTNALRRSAAIAPLPATYAINMTPNGLQTASGLITQTPTLTPPRTWGVELQFKY